MYIMIYYLLFDLAILNEPTAKCLHKQHGTARLISYQLSICGIILDVAFFMVPKSKISVNQNILATRVEKAPTSRYLWVYLFHAATLHDVCDNMIMTYTFKSKVITLRLEPQLAKGRLGDQNNIQRRADPPQLAQMPEQPPPPKISIQNYIIYRNVGVHAPMPLQKGIATSALPRAATGIYFWIRPCSASDKRRKHYTTSWIVGNLKLMHL